MNGPEIACCRMFLNPFFIEQVAKPSLARHSTGLYALMHSEEPVVRYCEIAKSCP